MHIDKAVSGFLLSLLLCAVITFGIMFYLDNMTLRGLTDVGTLVSLILFVLGGAAGGATGSNRGFQSLLIKTMSNNNHTIEQNDNHENRKSMAFGVVLMITAVVWCGLSFLAYYMFG